MASPATQRLKRREVGPAAHLPYLRHATENVVTLATRALITCVRIEGVSFETADPAELNDLHAKLNLALRNVADERLALWTHVVRRRSQDYPTGHFRSDFARDLDATYRKRLTAQDLYRNDLTLTLVWHPGRDPAERAVGLLSRLGRARSANDELDSGALKKLEDATRDLAAALAPYGPRRLGLYDRDGVVFSQVSEFLHELVSGEPLPVPLVHGPIGPALYTNRLIFGREAVEIRGAGRSDFAGMFGLKEYPATTKPGLLDGLLAAPMELVVTHAFAFLSKHEAKAVMTRKQNQLLSSNDPAASQIVDLDTALDDLESGRFVMGDHHVSVLVHRVTVAGHRDKALEYGKDLWMRFTLPTRHNIYFGLQAKRDKLDAAGASKSGTANVAEILNQVNMMLGHEIFDPETNRRVLVDHAFIVAGGQITKAARNWLGEHLDRTKRSQIIFMDRDDILNLFVVTNIPLPAGAIPPAAVLDDFPF